VKYESNNALFKKLQLEQSYAIMKLKQYERIGLERLGKSPGEDAWSAIQALEHIQKANTYYLSQVTEKLDKKCSTPSHYKPSLFGKQLIPLATWDGSKPFKTVKTMEPSCDNICKDTLFERLQKDQEIIANLINRAKSCNLNQGGIKLAAYSWLIRLNIGDALQLVVFHQRRHFDQADRALAS